MPKKLLSAQLLVLGALALQSAPPSVGGESVVNGVVEVIRKRCP